MIFYPGIENLILPMLSYPGCHIRAVHWLYWNSRDIVVKLRYWYVKVTSSCHVASQRIQELLGAFFNNIKCDGEQEKESIIRMRVG